MTYTIRFRSSGDSNPDSVKKPQISVDDKHLDNSTALTLCGKGYTPYGEILQTNLIQLLENFCSVVAPEPATLGQLWYDSKNNKLKIFGVSGSAHAWTEVGGSGSGGSSSSTGGLTIESDGSTSIQSTLKIKGSTPTSNSDLSVDGRIFIGDDTTDPLLSSSTIYGPLKLYGAVSIISPDNMNRINVNDATHANRVVTKKYCDTYFLNGALSTSSTGINLFNTNNVDVIQLPQVQLQSVMSVVNTTNATLTNNVISVQSAIATKDQKANYYTVEVKTTTPIVSTTGNLYIKLPAATDCVGLEINIILKYTASTYTNKTLIGTTNVGNVTSGTTNEVLWPGAVLPTTNNAKSTINTFDHYCFRAVPTGASTYKWFGEIVGQNLG